MHEIAKSAGVTKPVIYQHFSSKRALYIDLVEIVGDELCRRIRATAQGHSSAQERVIHGFLAFFTFAHNNRAGYDLLFANPQKRDADFRVTLEKIEDEVSELITSQLNAKIPVQERKFMAMGIIALAEGSVHRWLLEVDELDQQDTGFENTSGPKWALRVAGLAWNGLRGI